jgi:hypothetical protein
MSALSATRRAARSIGSERDSANIDAMHVLPPGMGLMPVITANATPGAN